MSILDTLGISEEQYEKAKDSTVTEAFEVAPSGVYDGKVKEVIIYKNKYFVISEICKRFLNYCFLIFSKSNITI